MSNADTACTMRDVSHLGILRVLNVTVGGARPGCAGQVPHSQTLIVRLADALQAITSKADKLDGHAICLDIKDTVP
jgi:hypothetical protein